MEHSARSARFFRIGFYCAGIVILALGLTLYTKTRLGSGAVVSLSQSVAALLHLTLGQATFLVYLLCVALRLALYRGRDWVKSLLQLPFSVVFGALIDFFAAAIPLSPVTLPGRFALLAAAMTLAAVGMGLSVTMRLVPNPADGLAQALGDATGRGTGTGKNILDAFCVTLALLTGIFLGEPFRFAGVGTLIAMGAVGRILALFNRLFQKRIETLAGLSPSGPGVNQA